MSTDDFQSDQFRYLDEILSGYQKSRLLISAVSAGIFEAMAGGRRTVEELSEELQLKARPVRMVLDALAVLGFLKKENPGYALTELASTFLLDESPATQKQMISHHSNLWNSWSTLDTVLRTGQREIIEKDDDEEAENKRRKHYIQGMKNLARRVETNLTEHFDLTGCGHLLDLGGGPAAHSIIFCEANPRLEVTVFDKGEVTLIGRENVLAAGLADRIRFQEGDFLEDPLGSGYDAVFLSNVVHIYSDETNRALIRKCAAAMNPGGLLGVKDLAVDAGRSGPMLNVIFALNMLVNTDEGDVYSCAEIQDWMRSAGLRPTGDGVALSERSWLVTARKEG